MIKLVLFVRRREGLTREQFRDYYESNHAPLAAGLMRNVARYARNFVAEEPAAAFDWDVMTEFWFDVDGPFAEARHRISDAVIQATLVEDEAKFMDRSSMRVVIVDEHETPTAQLTGGRD